MTLDDEPFQDCELDPETILGTHVRRRLVHRRDGNSGERTHRRDTGVFASDRRGSEGVRCEYRQGDTTNRTSGFREGAT